MLCFLSGHVPKDLELREAHESHLCVPSSFSVVEGDLKDLDGSHIVEDTQRGQFIRVGATEAGFSGRWSQHKKNSELRGPVDKQRRFSRMHPDESITQSVCGSKKGSIQDLKQRVGLGVKRSQADELVSLFEWDAEEEKELQQLPWNSLRSGSLTNRKCKHLTCLFEAAHSVYFMFFWCKHT